MQLTNFTTMAQVQGEYIFSKQEMVAVFNFSTDKKFHFFFSYGAVDRTASGTFSISGDTLQLKSDKEPGKDFTVTHQSRTGNGYVLQFEDANKYVLPDIRCIYFTGDEEHNAFADNKGQIKIYIDHCDKIYVQHQLFPDIYTLIKDEQNSNNMFTLTLNPSLAQVSFKGIDLIMQDDSTMSCLPNYFMMLENIEFKKQ